MSFRAASLHCALVTREAVLRPIGDVAVDLGTTTTQVFVRGEGVVVDDLTSVALDSRGKEALAFGRDGQQLAEADSSVQLIWPLREGTIAEPGVAGALLAAMVRPFAGGRISRFSLLLTVPSSASAMERRVLREAGKRAGASKVRLIEQTMAAAIGGNLPVDEAAGTMIVNVGGGITEASLVASGSTIANSAVRIGSSQIDGAIKSMLRRDYGIAITDDSAELVKLAVSGTATTQKSSQVIETRGLSVGDSSPATAILEVDELDAAFAAHGEAVIETVRATLVQAAPELSQDILVHGIHLSGGGSLSAGLAGRIAETFAIPVHVLSDPHLVAVMGAGSCLDSANSLQELFLAERS